MQVAIILLSILRVLDWSPVHKTAENLLLKDAASLEKVWLADGGKKEELPKVDFDKEMVVAVFAGAKEKPVRVSIERVVLNEDKLAVLYSVVEKGAQEEDKAVRPNVQVVVVEKKEVKETFFFDHDTADGKDFDKQLKALLEKK